MICPKCGTEYPSNSTECKHCKIALIDISQPSPTMYKPQYVGYGKVCPNCGEENALSATNCLLCGALLKGITMQTFTENNQNPTSNEAICPTCKDKIRITDTVCQNCGAELSRTIISNQPNDPPASGTNSLYPIWICNICGSENPNTTNRCRTCNTLVSGKACIYGNSDSNKRSKKSSFRHLRARMPIAVASAAVVLVVFVISALTGIFATGRSQSDKILAASVESRDSSTSNDNQSTQSFPSYTTIPTDRPNLAQTAPSNIESQDLLTSNNNQSTQSFPSYTPVPTNRPNLAQTSSGNIDDQNKNSSRPLQFNSDSGSFIFRLNDMDDSNFNRTSPLNSGYINQVEGGYILTCEILEYIEITYEDYQILLEKVCLEIVVGDSLWEIEQDWENETDVPIKLRIRIDDGFEYDYRLSSIPTRAQPAYIMYLGQAVILHTGLTKQFFITGDTTVSNLDDHSDDETFSEYLISGGINFGEEIQGHREYEGYYADLYYAIVSNGIVTHLSTDYGAN